MIQKSHFLKTFLTFFIILFSSNSYALKLKSDSIYHKSFLPEKHVFNGFGCEGENLSPHLSWSKIPENTKSFAITVYDPDAPTDSGWWHWIVYNIPPSITDIPEGVEISKLSKEAVVGLNDFGKREFGGACPPKNHSKHRYIFKVFALDVSKLPVDKNATPAQISYYIYEHKISYGQIKNYYRR